MINENTPQIFTKRLVLRKFAIEDAGALHELLSDVQVNTFLPWLAQKNIDETKDFLQNQFLKYYDKASAYRYAICQKENNLPIGYVCVSDKDSYDFGYALKKEFWHKGIATEAAMAVLHQLKKAGFAYITATHDINNPHSGGVMKNLGMKYQYTYEEQWQPKNILVKFRMYQLNFNRNDEFVYRKYWDISQNHFVEKNL